MEYTLPKHPDRNLYMDDVACFSTTWQDHLHLLDDGLQQLQEVRFRINPRKCEWVVEEIDFLEY